MPRPAAAPPDPPPDPRRGGGGGAPGRSPPLRGRKAWIGRCRTDRTGPARPPAALLDRCGPARPPFQAHPAASQRRVVAPSRPAAAAAAAETVGHGPIGLGRCHSKRSPPLAPPCNCALKAGLELGSQAAVRGRPSLLEYLAWIASEPEPGGCCPERGPFSMGSSTKTASLVYSDSD